MKLTTAILLLISTHVFCQDTTIRYVTYSIQHDTLVSTHFPRVITAHDTTITTHVTGYTLHHVGNKARTSTSGTFSHDSTYYDTIPAHDSVYICTLCAQHDTTVIVYIIDSAVIKYGVFVYSPTPVPLASKISTSKYIGCSTLRDNKDAGDHWDVQQIKDSGQFVALTYNNKPVQAVAYFPTQAELPQYAKTLDSNYHIAKPDIASCENEEGNQNYHKGTVQSYLLELDTFISVSHRNGIPTSNGGLTLGVVYALREWYRDRGRLDSVAWLNSALGLNPIINSYAQGQIDWYVPLLAGFAANQMDFVNIHWYEPPRTDTMPTTTSGVLGPLINYVATVTGKPVITTETGTRNHSAALLYELLDTWKAAGCKWIVYFDGDGNLAFALPEVYKAWLAQ